AAPAARRPAMAAAARARTPRPAPRRAAQRRAAGARPGTLAAAPASAAAPARQQPAVVSVPGARAASATWPAAVSAQARAARRPDRAATELGDQAAQLVAGECHAARAEVVVQQLAQLIGDLGRRAAGAQHATHRFQAIAAERAPSRLHLATTVGVTL